MRSSSGSGEDEPEERPASELNGSGLLSAPLLPEPRRSPDARRFPDRGAAKELRPLRRRTLARPTGRYFHLDDADREVLRTRRGDHNRLGFALQLGTVRFLGTFLDNPIEVPDVVVAHVARQLAITDLTCLTRYGVGETHWDHRQRDQSGLWLPRFLRPARSFPTDPLALCPRLGQRRAAQPAVRPGDGLAGRAKGLAAGRHRPGASGRPGARSGGGPPLARPRRRPQRRAM